MSIFFEGDVGVTFEFCHTSNEILRVSISRLQHIQNTQGISFFFEGDVGVTLDFWDPSNEILRFSTDVKKLPKKIEKLYNQS